MNTISILCVLLGLFSALIIAKDVRENSQSMKIMNSVWILTGLWAGLFGLWAYFAFGKSRKACSREGACEMNLGDMKSGEMKMDMPMSMNSHHQMQSMTTPSRPRWQSVVLSTLHCGAGCTLADIIGEWFMFFVPVVIGGSAIFGGWVFDYVLALIIGVYFQYVAIRSMQKLSRGKMVWKAIRADFLSLTAWQIGMFGWMAVFYFVILNGVAPDRVGWEFWFMMQVAMLCGFVVALPVNLLLIKLGIKTAM